MSRDRIEVAVERLHVHFQVRGRLGAVDQDGNPLRVSEAHDLADRVDGAQSVGDVGDRDDLRPIGQKPLELCQDELSAQVDRDHLQLRPFFLAQHLPGDDVGVVLEGRDQHFVARSHVRPTVGRRDEIDGFRRAAREDDLPGLGGVEETADRLPDSLVGLGRLHREPMHAAVNVRVVPLVEVPLRFDHRNRFLSGRGVVQIIERHPVNLLRQNRKVAADALHVERRRRRRGRRRRANGSHAAHEEISSDPVCEKRRPSSFSIWERIARILIRPATSAAKA